MRAWVVTVVLMLCLTGRGFAADLQTRNGQVVCDTLRAVEELAIAIGEQDDQSIAAMGSRGCHMPAPGSKMELLESYPDQTALLFGKLAEYTHIGRVPAHVEQMTNLAKVRLFSGDAAPMVGFTLVPVSGRSNVAD